MIENATVVDEIGEPIFRVYVQDKKVLYKTPIGKWEPVVLLTGDKLVMDSEKKKG